MSQLTPERNATTGGVDPERLAELTRRETEAFVKARPRSRELWERGQRSLVYGVPMHWLAQWPLPFPLYLSTAKGASVTDVDGNDYVDFDLGGCAGIWGHGNEQIAAAIQDQVEHGTSVMMASEHAAWVAEELGRRFGLPFWQFTTSATDANRFAIRVCRAMTGRDKILVVNHAYHGSVDETHVAFGDDGQMIRQPGVSPNALDLTRTTKLIEFNDVEALQAALEPLDVACVLTEPALTNGGIIPPEPTFHAALREHTRRTDTLLIIDETQTITTGPSGYTGAHGLEPDLLVLGKCIGGGVPAGAYGMTEAVASGMRQYIEREGVSANHGGFGGTLAGNTLAMRAIRATLEGPFTQATYDRTSALGERLERGLSAAMRDRDLPWHAVALGARVSCMYMPRAPRNGAEASSWGASELQRAIHLYLINRGVMIEPFHNTMLISAATTERDIDRHVEGYEAVLDELMS